MRWFRRETATPVELTGTEWSVAGDLHAPDSRAFHLTAKDLSELRLCLQSRRSKLMDEISQLRNKASDTESAWERILRLGAIDRKSTLLNEVKRALGRMDEHTYGYCERTEQPISLERLREIPWARCI